MRLYSQILQRIHYNTAVHWLRSLCKCEIPVLCRVADIAKENLPVHFIKPLLDLLHRFHHAASMFCHSALQEWVNAQ